MSDEPLHVTIFREMEEANANGLTDGEYLQRKLRARHHAPGRDAMGVLLDVSKVPKPESERADEAEMRRTGKTLKQLYADSGSSPIRVAEEKKAAPRRALTREQKETARIKLFDLACAMYSEPETIADVVKRGAIAMGISEDEPALPELTDDERRYCLDEAVTYVACGPGCPPEQYLFDLCVDIHYERMCIAMRWTKATPDQRGPIIRRSIMHRMGL